MDNYLAMKEINYPNELFEITEEDNLKPYMFYRQAGYWNVENIAQESNASGYIVQEVETCCTFEFEGIKQHLHYLEAWRVVNGQTEDYEEDNPDDILRCGVDGAEKYCIKASFGKRGYMVYKTKVYWIAEEDSLFEIVDGWKERTVKEAAKLKSVLFEECVEFQRRGPVGKRIFIHLVDFCDSVSVRNSIVSLYEDQLKSKSEFVRYELEELLVNSEYKDLIDDICAEYGI
jgi:hypothetical protein